MKSKGNNHFTSFTPNLSPLKANNTKARTTKNLLSQKTHVANAHNNVSLNANGGNNNTNTNNHHHQVKARNKISINNINVNAKHFNVNASGFDFAVFTNSKIKHTPTSKDVASVSNTNTSAHTHSHMHTTNGSTSNSLTKKIISNLRNQFNEITKHKCTSVSTSVNIQSTANSNYHTPNAFVGNNAQPHANIHCKGSNTNTNTNTCNHTQQDSSHLHLTTQHSSTNSKSKNKQRNVQHQSKVKSDNMSYTSNIKLKAQKDRKGYTCINSRNNSKCKDNVNYYETEHLTLESLNLEDMKKQYMVTDLAQERITHTVDPVKPRYDRHNLLHVIDVLKNIILVQQRSYHETIAKYKKQCEHVHRQLQNKVDFLLQENNALKRYVLNIFACVSVYEDTMQSEDNKRNQLLSKMLIENVYLRQMNQYVGDRKEQFEYNRCSNGKPISLTGSFGVREGHLNVHQKHKKATTDNLNLTYIHVDNASKGNQEWAYKDKYSQVLVHRRYGAARPYAERNRVSNRLEFYLR